jgi:hypothetical protein
MTKPTDFPAAGPLEGDEVLPVIQGGVDSRTTPNQIIAELGTSPAELSAVLADPTRVGGVPYRPANMSEWFTALENARTTPANVVVFGDSVAVGGTQGNLTTAIPWTWLLEGHLNRYVQLDPPGGFVPAAVGAVGPHVDESTGTGSSQDFANKASTISGAQYIQHTFANIDRVSVVYRQQPGSSQIRVRDGGPAGTILATIASTGVSAYSQIWTSDLLTPGEHTIYIDSGGGGGTQVVAGLYGYNDNYDQGVRVWPATKSGATSNTAVLGLLNGYASDLIAQVDPDLVIYATGFNDNANYDTYMRGQLDAYMPLAPNASHVLLIPYILPTQGARWDEAQVALAYQIAEDYGLGVIDQSIGVPDLSQDDADLLFDSTHPNAAGSRRMGYHALSIVSGDPMGSLLKVADDGWTQKSSTASTPNAVSLVGSLQMRDLIADEQAQIVLLGAALSSLVYGVNQPVVGWGDGDTFPDTILYRAAAGILTSPGLIRAAAAVGDADLMTLAQRTRDSIFGDGSDGAFVGVGGTTTLTRDMQYTNVSGTGTIVTNGFRVMIKGTLSGSVAFTFNGNPGVGSAAGAAVIGWYWSSGGGAGGTAAGTAATATTPNKCLGVAGGVGGTGSGGAGGGAAYSAITVLGSGVGIADVSKIAPITLWNGRTMSGNIVPQAFVGGSGGGGGGGDGTAGGGGGAGGGALCVFAYDPRTWTGDMSAVGGAGAAAVAGNRGGGAGGGGGFIGLVCGLGAPTAPGARSVTGGAGGAGFGTGTAGANGSTGTAINLLVGTA